MYTSIFILVVILAFGSGQKNATRDVSAWIESPKITNWGTFAPEAICEEGAYVTGFRIKNQPEAGLLLDDTSLNAVELICGSPTHTPTHIQSGEGARGSWGSYFECAPPSRATGFQLRSEGIDFDNTAGNNLALYCDDGIRMEANGNTWGDWTERLNCPLNTHLCGIRTQIAVALPTVNDDTALNNVDMACCTDE